MAWLIERHFAIGPPGYFKRQHIANVWVGLSGEPLTFPTKRAALQAVRAYGLTRVNVVQQEQEDEPQERIP